jgi:hypothetical protein
MIRFLPDCGDYEYSDEVDCTGEDTESAIGQFSSLWLWIIFTVVFFFGLMISWVRDVLPEV